MRNLFNEAAPIVEESKLLTKRRLNDYRDAQIDLKKGESKSIPFFGLDSFNKLIPGIVPGLMYKITSHSGMGKTQFAKFAFVIKPIEYCIKNNIPYTCIYIALEESKQEFIDSLFIYVLRTKYNVVMNRFKLDGTSNTALNKSELDAIKKASEDVALYMSYIHIVDDYYKPSKLFEYLRHIAEAYGEFEIHQNYKGEDYEMFKPKIKGHKFLVVTDHISLLDEELDSTGKVWLDLRKSMANWHTKMLLRHVSKQWKFAVLNIQQQNLASESAQFTSKGEFIVEKVLPTLDGLADNKTILRDDVIVLGLFSPERYGIENFRGFRISNPIGSTEPYLGDNFRSLHVLKSRYSPPNKVLPLYFDGSFNYFEELPIPIPANKPKLLKYYKRAEIARKLI